MAVQAGSTLESGLREAAGVATALASLLVSLADVAHQEATQNALQVFDVDAEGYELLRNLVDRLG